VLSDALLRRRELVLADLIPGTLVRDVLLVLGFAALTGLSAQISIRLPFTPVPVTGQTLAVLLGGMALGAPRAVLGMLAYLGIGLIGLPWFAGGAGGWAVVGSASFGYLLGFIVAATVVGALAARGFDRGPLRVLLAMAVGNALIYLLGATWLALDLHLGVSGALFLGVTPFLLGDALKAAVAMGLLPSAWRLAGRRSEPPG
jgi:biotin transport system substrate-specific component